MTLRDPEAHAVVRLCYEAGHLKHSRRTGWWVAGIKDPETVAEHSWRTAVIAYFIATAEGADAERAVTIGVFHDLAETRIGDIEYVGRHYLQAASGDAITKDQVRDLPAVMAEAVLGIVAESEGRATPEAVCARDADKLECLLQAREYQRNGHSDVQAWIDNMVAAMRTETGRALAARALLTDPADWWREVSESWAARARAEGTR